MNLTLHLTPETEALLKEQAVESGKTIEAVVMEAIEEKLKYGPEASRMLPLEQWHAKFDEFLASLPRSEATFVDDSRESIYEGRGE